MKKTKYKCKFVLFLNVNLVCKLCLLVCLQVLKFQFQKHHDMLKSVLFFFFILELFLPTLLLLILQPWFWVQSYQQKIFLFSCQIFCFQKIPTDFSCSVPIKNFCKNLQEPAPASCTKKSAHNFVFVLQKKKLSFKIFWLFYRKFFKPENIFDKIKPWG